MKLKESSSISKQRGSIQFEESIGDLQHQHVRMVVFVAYEDPLTRPPHTILLVVLFKTL